jgi:uncharacterized membrane protein YbaN (DUF454 family)
MKTLLFRILGFALFLFGTVGVFLPFIPTVPLYLLSLFLLSKGSKKDIARLKRIPLLGRLVYPYIKRASRYTRRWNTQPQSSSI